MIVYMSVVLAGAAYFIDSPERAEIARLWYVLALILAINGGR